MNLLAEEVKSAQELGAEEKSCSVQVYTIFLKNGINNCVLDNLDTGGHFAY